MKYVIITPEGNYFKRITALGYVEFTATVVYAAHFENRLDVVAMVNMLWDLSIEATPILVNVDI